MSPSALVLGLGNILLHDEGIGGWVTDSLSRRFRFPPGVALLEGGTLGLDLLPRLSGLGRLLLVDAVTLGRAPGTLVRLEGEEVPAVLDVKISPHQVGVRDLLATARLMAQEPPHVVLWGMEPGRLDPGTGFSPDVARALPALESRVLGELAAWGFAAEPVAAPPPPPIWWQRPTRAESTSTRRST